MNFRLLKVKYTALFAGIALVLLVVVVADYFLVNSVRNQMLEFSRSFTPAISAILGAL